MIERCLVLWKEMQLKRLFKTQRWELKNMIVCRNYNGKVKVMGWSGETSVHGFFLWFVFAISNIYVQSKEKSFDNQFISMYVFILAL